MHLGISEKHLNKISGMSYVKIPMNKRLELKKKVI